MSLVFVALKTNFFPDFSSTSASAGQHDFVYSIRQTNTRVQPDNCNTYSILFLCSNHLGLFSNIFNITTAYTAHSLCIFVVKLANSLLMRMLVIVIVDRSGKFV